MNKTEVKVRVIYADTDVMGVVYHTNYIKWFEIGRAELFREMGITYKELESRGYYLPMTDLKCHFLASAIYDDIVVVETTLSYLKRSIIRFDYNIWDENKEKLLVEGYTLQVFVDKKRKIVRAPIFMLEMLDR